MFFESRGKRHDGESDDPVRLWIDAQDVTLVIFNVLAFDVFGVFQRHVQDIRGWIICNRHNERLAVPEKYINFPTFPVPACSGPYAVMTLPAPDPFLMSEVLYWTTTLTMLEVGASSP